MASIYTPDSGKVSLDDLRTLIVFLFARVSSDPLAAAFVAPVKALRGEWSLVAAKEIEVDEAVTVAQAGAVAADTQLNRASGQVKNAIHKGKKPDLGLPLHKLYFGSASPSVFERPTLAAQLDSMRAWPSLLSTAAQPELTALVTPVTDAVKVGDDAEKTVAAAVATRNNFRLGGERKKIFDQFNSLCATTHGALKALVHDHPELNLDGSYPESFFHRAPTSRGQAALTLDEANSTVQSLEEQLAAAKTQRDELQSQADAHAEQLKTAEGALVAAQAAKKKADDAEQAALAALAAAEKLAPKKAKK